jgi:hypothetical protein
VENDRGTFNKKNNLEVWLTDDCKKRPVLIKSKIKIGSIVARLVPDQKRIGGQAFAAKTVQAVRPADTPAVRPDVLTPPASDSVPPPPDSASPSQQPDSSE